MLAHSLEEGCPGAVTLSITNALFFAERLVTSNPYFSAKLEPHIIFQLVSSRCATTNNLLNDRSAWVTCPFFWKTRRWSLVSLCLLISNFPYRWYYASFLLGPYLIQRANEFRLAALVSVLDYQYWKRVLRDAVSMSLSRSPVIATTRSSLVYLDTCVPTTHKRNIDAGTLAMSLLRQGSPPTLKTCQDRLSTSYLYTPRP